jgi:ankyrin repeat protein
MGLACSNGDTRELVRLFRAGQSVNCVDERGLTPLMVVLSYGHGIDTVSSLTEIGADLTLLSSSGANVLHYASAGGQLESVDLMLANTNFDINSTSNNGSTPICSALLKGHYEMVKHLMMKGANLFANLDGGLQALDVPVHNVHNEPLVLLGPRALNHAKKLKWEASKPLLLLSSRISETSSSDETTAHPQPSPLLVSVLGNLDLVRVIATFFLPNIITVDPSPSAPLTPD